MKTVVISLTCFAIVKEVAKGTTNSKKKSSLCFFLPCPGSLAHFFQKCDVKKKINKKAKQTKGASTTHLPILPM